MKRSAFAALCGIGKSMVSKYESQGFVTVVAGEVDVLATLEALDGRLDEDKRQKALKVFTNENVPAASLRSAPTAGRQAVSSAKAQKDEVELDLKRLELALKAGEVVYVSDVAEQSRMAIAAMRETFINGLRDDSAKLCAKFDIPADRVGAVSRMLKEIFETGLGRFAQSARALGTPEAASMQVSLSDPADGFSEETAA